MLGGIRHYVWDFILGMEAGQREMLAWANLVASTLLTLLIWTLFVWLS
jgi:succinate dehydrogenase / fumarate reductase, cytochrome b subunit